MAKWITHRMTLFSLAYCDWYGTICEELGITEQKILAKLHPRYKEKRDGKVYGKDRCDRFMFWANCKSCNAEDHYQRLDMIKRYIKTIYPRLVREVAKEEAKEQFLTDLKDQKVRTEAVEVKVTVINPKLKRKKENPLQMEFDFGEEFK